MIDVLVLKDFLDRGRNFESHWTSADPTEFTDPTTSRIWVIKGNTLHFLSETPGRTNRVMDLNARANRTIFMEKTAQLDTYRFRGIPRDSIQATIDHQTGEVKDFSPIPRDPQEYEPELQEAFVSLLRAFPHLPRLTEE